MKNLQNGRSSGRWAQVVTVQRVAGIAVAAIAQLLLAVPGTAGAAPVAARELQAALALTGDPARGAALFDTCAACHGRDGGGARDGTVPAIAGQHYPVLVAALVAFRSRGRNDIRMEHFADRRHLQGAQDLADVASVVARLPPTRDIGLGDGRNLSAGTALYFRACAGCHGTSGQGKPESRVPRLAGQHYEYLLRQLEDTLSARRPTMLPDHAALLRAPAASAEQLTGVADYLSRVGLNR